MAREESLDVIPLGGLGEFGMNMMALRWRDDIVLIDCGKMFPENSHLGIDSIIPDFSFVERHSDKIRAVMLTHGHDDHIGGVPYLARLIEAPFFGTPLTLGLTRMRLREHGLLDSTELIEVSQGDTVSAGPFEAEFIGVSHGIPDSCALAIDTPAGAVIHTGDFKLDQTPLDGQITDYHTLARRGREGVLLLLSDSTNVERPGYTISERDVYDGFEHIFASARGLILVASFASHFHRMQQVIDLAHAYGRQVAFCGRSMEQNSRLAQELGHLDVPAGLEISSKQAGKQPPEKVVVLATGSQAEPNSALSKIALDRHPHVKLGPEDVVALSARKIPGNERSISAIINHLYRRGAEVIHEPRFDIHASGHAHAEELKLMINLVKPRFFVPIHGEYRMLYHHTLLASEILEEPDSILLAESGDVVSVCSRSIGVSGKVEVGWTLIDSGLADELGETVVRDRKHLAGDGVVVPIVIVSCSPSPSVVSLQFAAKGLSGEGDGEGRDILAEAESLVVEIVESSRSDEIRDDELMKARIGKALRKFLLKRLGNRPMILPQILEV